MKISFYGVMRQVLLNENLEGDLRAAGLKVALIALIVNFVNHP